MYQSFNNQKEIDFYKKCRGVGLNILDMSMASSTRCKVWLFCSNCFSIDPIALQIIMQSRLLKLEKFGLEYHVPSLSSIYGENLLSVVQNGHTLSRSEIDDLLWKSENGDVNELYLRKFIKQKVYPAFLYTFWARHENSVRFTRPVFGRNCHFPLGVVIPALWASRRKNELLSILGGPVLMHSDDIVEKAVLKQLKAALETINSILLCKNYLTGDEPCAADAYLFSLLMPMWKVDLKWKNAQTVISCFEHVVDYINRLDLMFNEQVKTSGFKEHQSLSVKNLIRKEKVKNVVKNTFIISSSILCLLSYSVWARLIKIR